MGGNYAIDTDDDDGEYVDIKAEKESIRVRSEKESNLLKAALEQHVSNLRKELTIEQFLEQFEVHFNFAKLLKPNEPAFLLLANICIDLCERQQGEQAFKDAACRCYETIPMDSKNYKLAQSSIQNLKNPKWGETSPPHSPCELIIPVPGGPSIDARRNSLVPLHMLPPPMLNPIVIVVPPRIVNPLFALANKKFTEQELASCLKLPGADLNELDPHSNKTAARLIFECFQNYSSHPIFDKRFLVDLIKMGAEPDEKWRVEGGDLLHSAWCEANNRDPFYGQKIAIISPPLQAKPFLVSYPSREPNLLNPLFALSKTNFSLFQLFNAVKNPYAKLNEIDPSTGDTAARLLFNQFRKTSPDESSQQEFLITLFDLGAIPNKKWQTEDLITWTFNSDGKLVAEAELYGKKFKR